MKAPVLLLLVFQVLCRALVCALYDAETVRRRAKHVRESIPSSVKLMSVVKNVYDVAPFAHALQGHVDYFGVASWADAKRVRDAAPGTPVALLYPTEPNRASEAVAADIDLAVPSIAWLEAAVSKLQRVHGSFKGSHLPSRPLALHLWVDTGMGRAGVLGKEAVKLAAAIGEWERKGFVRLAGVATHLCCMVYLSSRRTTGLASEEVFSRYQYGNRSQVKAEMDEAHCDPTLTSEQLNRFDAVLEQLQEGGFMGPQTIVHAGASGVVHQNHTAAYYDMVRVGRYIIDHSTLQQDEAVISDQVQTSVEAFSSSCITQTATVKTLPRGWCLGYGCERMKFIQPVGRLSNKTRVVYLSGECASRIGSFATRITPVGVDAQTSHSLGPVLLNHGGCGVVMKIPDGVTIQNGQALKVWSRGEDVATH